MTKEEFLNELKECGNFYTHFGRIRQVGTDYCPILAIANKRNLLTKKHSAIEENSWAQQYAKWLGIDPSLAFEIIAAADNNGDYHYALRPELLDLCKIGASK